MSNRKKIIISIFSLALCVLVTFAWINEVQNPEGRVLALRLNDAAIATSELEVRLSANVQDDVFEDITKLCDDHPDMELEAYEDFAPGCRKKFRVDITNLSEYPTSLRLILSDIICDNEDLRSNIIIGTNGFDGFDSNYPEPIVQNKTLENGLTESGRFTLVDYVEIPPHNVDKPVSIYFYIMFAATGTELLEDTSFSIGTINFLTI
jgi:hypothetical protein